MSSGFAHVRSFADSNLPVKSSKPLARVESTSLPVDVVALQNASRVLQEWLARDSTIIPDLGDLLTSRMWYTTLFKPFLTYPISIRRPSFSILHHPRRL